MVLLEKEWIKFGYKFSHRSGHLNNLEDTQQKSWSEASKMFGAATKFLGSTFQSSVSGNSNASSETWTPNHEKPKEFSPIFSQFLDCVYQLWIQYPTAFEFDERLLGVLNQAVYSCEFGTFLTNSDKERTEFLFNGKSIFESTPSLWSYINSNRLNFANVIYNETADTLVAKFDNLKYWKFAYSEACGIVKNFQGNESADLVSKVENQVPQVQSNPRIRDLSMESLTDIGRRLTNEGVVAAPEEKISGTIASSSLSPSSLEVSSSVAPPPLENPWH